MNQKTKLNWFYPTLTHKSPMLQVFPDWSYILAKNRVFLFKSVSGKGADDSFNLSEVKESLCGAEISFNPNPNDFSTPKSSSTKAQQLKQTTDPKFQTPTSPQPKPAQCTTPKKKYTTLGELAQCDAGNPVIRDLFGVRSGASDTEVVKRKMEALPDRFLQRTGRVSQKMFHRIQFFARI